MPGHRQREKPRHPVDRSRRPVAAGAGPRRRADDDARSCPRSRNDAGQGPPVAGELFAPWPRRAERYHHRPIFQSTDTNSDRTHDSRTHRTRKRQATRRISPVTGSELKQLREDLGHAIGRSLSAADMAKLCGLAPGNGPDTIRRWEVRGPSGPAGELLRILAMASDRYPILENFNIFDRFNIDEKDRPARREAFRENMRDEIRRRLG